MLVEGGEVAEGVVGGGPLEGSGGYFAEKTGYVVGHFSIFVVVVCVCGPERLTVFYGKNTRLLTRLEVLYCILC